MFRCFPSYNVFAESPSFSPLTLSIGGSQLDFVIVVVAAVVVVAVVVVAVVVVAVVVSGRVLVDYRGYTQG